jgi:protein subunit release factor A
MEPEEVRLEVFRPAIIDAPFTIRLTHVQTGTVVQETDRSKVRARAKAFEALEEALAKLPHCGNPDCGCPTNRQMDRIIADLSARGV